MYLPNPNQITSVLPGVHVSEETAYLISDYPYGRLRCQKRVWLETSPRKGVRMVTRTSNPKRGNDWNNASKAGVYSRYGGTLYLDENNHVQFAGVTEYDNFDELQKWAAIFGAGNVMPAKFAAWFKMKKIYTEKLAASPDPADYKNVVLASRAAQKEMTAEELELLS